MYVDPRVALARAKLHLSERAVDSTEIEAPLWVALKQAEAFVLRKGLARRAMLKHYQNKVMPEILQCGFQSWILVDDTTMEAKMIAAIVVCNVESGMQGYCYRYDIYPLLRRRASNVLFTVTQHAVARCLQRNGSMKLQEIFDELQVVSSIADHMRRITKDAGWKQAIVPTPKGAFVGGIDRDGGITLRTYLRPGLNGRETKWVRLLAEIPPFPDGRKRRDLEGWIAETREKLLSVDMAARFPFMTRDYEPTEDPTDALWNAARDA